MFDLSQWISRGNALTDLNEDFPDWQQQLQDAVQKADVDGLTSEFWPRTRSMLSVRGR